VFVLPGDIACNPVNVTGQEELIGLQLECDVLERKLISGRFTPDVCIP
jgi:hypothetical protein